VKVRDSEDYHCLPETLQREIQESSAYSFVEIGSTRKKPVAFSASSGARKAKERETQPLKKSGSAFSKRTTTRYQQTEK
jgi:hypothetical protein